MNNPALWDDGIQYYDSELEAQLSASLKQKRGPDQSSPSDRPAPVAINATCLNTGQYTPYADQIAGSGVAIIDAYLTIREYAHAKGLHLAEIGQNGIDLQDLISTLIIDSQRKAEQQPRRNWGNR